ncbi:hypothetical protein C8D77_101214 [Mesorhizobium loti]|uniref:Uncharacterized protein n=1 Tax=Rhizobium loti TaxID=381 RepID=A0A8E2WIC7_RHILI|nr:hypothetical protein [Mesorhizobium loti]PWJ93535.1 hypothetical protein C8D77_101214 [Mesorhizobium loti]
MKKRVKDWNPVNASESEIRQACWDLAARKSCGGFVSEAYAEQVWWDAGGVVDSEIAAQVAANRQAVVISSARVAFNEILRGM